jgi:hypothetical protein
MVERRRYYEEKIVFTLEKVRVMGIRLVDGNWYIKENLTKLYLGISREEIKDIYQRFDVNCYILFI